MYIGKSETLRVFPCLMFVEDNTYSCSKMNTLELQCMLLELENRYLTNGCHRARVQTSLGTLARDGRLSQQEGRTRGVVLKVSLQQRNLKIHQT